MAKQPNSQRQDLLQVIASNPFQTHPRQAKFWHGRVFSKEQDEENRMLLLLPPTMTWESPDKPRDDHHNTNIEDDPKSWLTASEYQDEDRLMQLKIQKLAELLRQSKKTVVYSGAGISVAAGIGQAARGSSQNGTKKHPIFGITKANKMSAKPTPTHYALGALASNDLIHGWIQQNHDGLPQKAGFPQDKINEIHGSWYDPSNPVVKYSGSLRHSEYKWMVKEAESADLVLVLGTSLSGLNADQVPIKAAHRSLQGKSLGMVIINLQQTPQDGKASLRIFGSTDNVFRQLFHHMKLAPVPKSISKQYKFPKDKKFLIPYDAQGDLYLVSNGSGGGGNNDGDSYKMVWDLNVNAKVQIVNHNVEGAGQPSHQPVLAQNPELIGRVIAWDNDSMSIQISISGAVFRLGYWWIETAMQGRALTLPLVNVSPKFGGDGTQ
ncbi:unnamed protein product [Cylindrotheca closterium]|uniref:Deacetylase sirtuin-type domain-containing protein n=1 Tax=Cylindrotheca closterium TaxID=2856 RepID=A0AAD2G6Y8_9STRA|nr:unnamed protein product [Cylindrotheca closterium]